MAQNGPLFFISTNASGESYDQSLLFPLRDRNGIYEYGYRVHHIPEVPNGIDQLLPEGSDVKLTASVRPGTPANFITKTPRVKRKVIVKLQVPVDVPGETGTIVDFINFDLSISVPVDVSRELTDTVVKTIPGLLVDSNVLEEMVTQGHEPY